MKTMTMKKKQISTIQTTKIHYLEKQSHIQKDQLHKLPKSSEKKPFLEMVAFIVGGKQDEDAEVFSPDGRCSFSLDYSPTKFLYPIVGLINGRITICPRSGSVRCVQFDPSKDSATSFTNLPSLHNGSPGRYR